jgi:radical SAM superfamily enzyme YgiQ (UPF0313 family)
MEVQNKLNIFLADLVHDYLPGNYIVPLNIGYLASYLNEKFGAQVNITLFKSPAKIFDAIKNESDLHIVGFSNYSWNQELNHHLMKRVHAKFPETVICSGGPHIRTEREGIFGHLKKYNFLDYYCMFEGEVPLGNLVEYFLSKGEVIKKEACDREIPGVAYLSSDELVYQPIEFKKGIIENVPSPYLSGSLDEFLMSIQWEPMLETNRGCPYHCTFCVWGIASMDNLRKFPLERTLEEIDYIANISRASRWLFADANFGILDRDIEIAERLREVSKCQKTLKSAEVFWAKNASARIKKISRVLGPLVKPAAAVQSMDIEILKIMKRGNIKISAMEEMVEEFQDRKLKVTTDVLSGLPGESLESHLTSLRKVFDVGFDSIEVGHIRLLPGSEMEGDESRKTYGLETKYRLIAGSYGKYDEAPIFDYEESIRASKDMSVEEMHFLRIVHFFIWVFWNVGMAKPILKWFFIQQGKNPLDIILTLIEQKERFVELKKFIEEFDKEAREEWFDSPEELVKHYESNFDALIENGFVKLNYKYLAKLLLDKNLARTMVDILAHQCDLEVADELAQFSFECIYFMDSSIPEKEIVYSKELIEILELIYPANQFTSGTCSFRMDPNVVEAISHELERFEVERDPVRALVLTLELYKRDFLYEFSFETACSASQLSPNVDESLA